MDFAFIITSTWFFYDVVSGIWGKSRSGLQAGNLRAKLSKDDSLTARMLCDQRVG